ncbi:MAG: cyclic pyranopterin monophosphate synthase MoaC [Deltaproteobacteria bacterium]|nr:cyclic pyranopterin monophosphate synthase MoaC [Deltaproteobacteria bacterium]
MSAQRPKLPHLDSEGAAHMVDVGTKDATHRVAVAEAFVRMSPATVQAIEEGNLKKGDALSVARIAGILAAKKTADLIPLAHPLSLSHVAVDVKPEAEGVRIEARVETRGPTGVEMEALVAAALAALSLYDMAKAAERGMVIERLQLMVKQGGRSGDWVRDGTREIE